jgi:uncharacterized OB-fold protein
MAEAEVRSARPGRPEPMYRNWYDDGFRAACEEGEFRLLRCEACGTVVFPAGPVCYSCLSDDLRWAPMSGGGVLYSWVRFHRRYFPELEPPYECGSIQLDEGPLFITALEGFDSLTTESIGARVELRMVRFENVTLPIAYPADPIDQAGA